MADGRVLIALADGPLVAAPTWTRLDDFPECRCYGFDSQSGRESELDTTDTGTARVYFHDRAGFLEEDSFVGLQILLQLWDPVAEAWVPRWRGHIDDITRTPHAGAPELVDTQIDCVDIFDYLGGVKFLPGIMGDAIALNDVVFYEDENFDDRIIALCDDAGIESTMRIPFTGNVVLNEVLYDPDDVILQGLRDAVDGEFPGIANLYCDRLGRVVAHGRRARIDPEGVATAEANWDFVRWEAATREDVTAGVAQIRSFTYNRPRARIINSYLAWPRADENGVEFDRSLIAGLLETDPTSIAAYGYRGREAPDLLIKENFNNSNTGAVECGLFAEFYVTNYAFPRKAVQTCTFKSIRPGDARAEATWLLMTTCDISDAIQLTVDEAGLADEAYFIDGLSVQCRVLNPEFDLVTVTPNLTPGSYYDTEIFD